MANKKIVDQQRREVLRAFNDVISGIGSGSLLTQVTELIQAGRIDQVIDALQLDRARFEPLEHAIAEAYRTGGLIGAEQIGRVPVDGIGVNMVFDVRSTEAERWLRKLSSDRIVEITGEQRNVVRGVLETGMRLGQNPRRTALDIVGGINPITKKRIGGVLGLTEAQLAWVDNARNELMTLNPNYLTRGLRDRAFDNAVKDAIKLADPLPQSVIDNAIARMREKALKLRGETIARTESLNALRAGHHEAVRQAVEMGDVESGDVVHIWDATGDERTREDHMEADGQRRPIDEPFDVGGDRLMYPGDPDGSPEQTIACRCVERVEIDFAGQVRRIEGFG